MALIITLLNFFIKLLVRCPCKSASHLLERSILRGTSCIIHGVGFVILDRMWINKLSNRLLKNYMVKTQLALNNLDLDDPHLSPALRSESAHLWKGYWRDVGAGICMGCISWGIRGKLDWVKGVVENKKWRLISCKGGKDEDCKKVHVHSRSWRGQPRDHCFPIYRINPSKCYFSLMTLMGPSWTLPADQSEPRRKGVLGPSWIECLLL